MPDSVLPYSRSYGGFNPLIIVGHRIAYNSGGTGTEATSRTYTSSIVVPPYSLLFDVGAVAEALWTGSGTVSLKAGDADDDDGFLAATDLKATELLAEESIQIGAGTALAGGMVGAFIANSQWGKGGGGGVYGRWAAVARTITFKVTCSGTATAGVTRVYVVYAQFSGSEPLGVPTYATA